MQFLFSSCPGLGSLAVWRGLAAAALVALAACGGGGGDTDAPACAAPADVKFPWLREDFIVAQKNDDTVSWDQIVTSNRLDGDGPVCVRQVDQLGKRPIYLLAPRSPDEAERTLAVLQRAADDKKKYGKVVFATLNRAVHAPEFSKGTRFGAIKNSVSAIGNDEIGRMEPADRAWAEVEWDKALRVAELKTIPAKGKGVKVAVLDTGVDSHPLLFGTRGRGVDFIDVDESPEEVPVGRLEPDAYGHGTFVASIIARLAPEATILPVRVLNGHGVGTLWTVLKGLAWAAEQEVQVINLSLGTDVGDFALELMTLIATCDAYPMTRTYPLDHAGFDADAARCGTEKEPRHAVVVAGEGNNASTTPLFPAGFDLPGLVAVAASEPGGALAAFSNRGAAGELAAPGQFILGAFPRGQVAVMNGTSMATPWVSGTAALLFSSEAPKETDTWTTQSVIARMRATARPLCRDDSIKEVDPLAAITDTAPRACR
jgi:subtilisin family serine protease